jgi:hypothetical protein
VTFSDRTLEGKVGMRQLLGIWTIRKKLMAAFFGAAALVGMVGGVAWWSEGVFMKDVQP